MTTIARTRPVRTHRQLGSRIGHYLMLAILYLVLIISAVFFVFPFYTMIVASFMKHEQLFTSRPNIWPQEGFRLNSYHDLFGELPFARNILNSLALATGQTIGVLFFCSLAGYTFAKRHFPGRDWLFIAMLGTMVLPYQSTLIPWFLLMVRFHWINTLWPFWVPWWAPAFGIFLMRQLIAASVPDELLDAATVDGCTNFAIYWRVVLPVSIPGLAVLGILNFMNAYKDFLYSLLIFSKTELYTAPLALALFRGSQIVAPRYTVMFAGSVLATIPLLIVFFAFQRQLISGIMSGAIKGGA